MTNPVGVDDLAARWRPLSDEETTVAAALLADAWALATTQVPGLLAAVNNGTADFGVITAVLSAMVLRVMRNPDGVRQWSVDDYSEMRDSSVSAGALYLSEDELSLLGSAFGARPRRAFSVGPTDDGCDHSGRWLSDPYRFAPYGEYDGYGYWLGGSPR